MSNGMILDRLATVIREITGLAQTRKQARCFELYLDQIVLWSRAQRLTGFRTPDEIVERLFIDSLLFLPLIPPRPCLVADVGSGVGVPGIPLRIVSPGISLTLIEARRKRVSFLNAVVRALGLENVEVLHGRAERLVQEVSGLAAGYDAVVMRSVGRAEAVFSIAASYLKVGGVCVISGPPPDRPMEPALPPPGFRMEMRRLGIDPLGLQRTFLLLVKIT